MVVEAGSREGNAINGLDKRNRSEQDRISGMQIATRDRGDIAHCYGQLFS